MDNPTHKKHKRSYSISRFEELNIDILSQNRTKENLEDISTKESPVRDTPVQINLLAELNQVIETITNAKRAAIVLKDQKNREIRKLIMKEMYKNQAKENGKTHKKRTMNNSMGKITDKSLNTKNKKPVFKTKSKKQVLLKKTEESSVKLVAGPKPSNKSTQKKTIELIRAL